MCPSIVRMDASVLYTDFWAHFFFRLLFSTAVIIVSVLWSLYLRGEHFSNNKNEKLLLYRVQFDLRLRQTKTKCATRKLTALLEISALTITLIYLLSNLWLLAMDSIANGDVESD